MIPALPVAARLAGAGRPSWGWTLVELLLAMAIVGALMAIAIPQIRGARERARVAQAIADIRALESLIAEHRLATRRLPDDLAAVGWADVDPWGRPYRYVKFEGLDWAARARVDRFQVPINSRYDLYSVGRDGRTALPLQFPVSRDDLVRANDGAFVGLAARY